MFEWHSSASPQIPQGASADCICQLENILICDDLTRIARVGVSLKVSLGFVPCPTLEAARPARACAVLGLPRGPGGLAESFEGLRAQRPFG